MSGGPMNRIGVLTGDFSFYFDVIRYLKAKGAPFRDIEPDSTGAQRPGVVISTADEFEGLVGPGAIHYILLDHGGTHEKSAYDAGKGLVHFASSAEAAADMASILSSGKWHFVKLSIGIDPGEKPGVVAIGDGKVLSGRQVVFPEDVLAVVKHWASVYPAENLFVRIGHGADTFRNRIINALLSSDIPGMKLQVVDESGTTRTRVEADINAAESIARMSGSAVLSTVKLMPTDGEIHDIQRRSRMRGNGQVTVSRVLAELVARGNITLEEAVQIQENPNKAKYYFKKREVPGWAQREFYGRESGDSENDGRDNDGGNDERDNDGGNDERDNDGGNVVPYGTIQ